MVPTSSLRAEHFLLALRAKLQAAPEEAVKYATGSARAWSSFMFGVLEGAAVDCGMVSCAARSQNGPAWARREHLYDVTWFRTSCGDWETPELILEHENQYEPLEFLKDFWKLLLGFAPIRVMIGYCKEEAERTFRIEEVNRILAGPTSHIRLPNTVDDLILLGHDRMKPTDFAVYRRHEGKFEQTVDSLDALMPNPRDTKAWQAYLEKLQVGMANRLHAEVARLRERGIIDEHGKLLIDTLPPDMAPDAETSVITG